MSIVPADILSIMEKEYSDMCLNIIQEVCALYQLDIEDVKNKLRTKLSMTFDINDTKNNYRYVKRAPPKKVQQMSKESDTRGTSDTQCIANLYDFSLKTSRRCTNKRDTTTRTSCLFCSTHLRMHYGGRLAYGVEPSYEKEYKEFCALPQPIKDDIKQVAVKKQSKYLVK
jgi:hypothetical protein